MSRPPHPMHDAFLEGVKKGAFTIAEGAREIGISRQLGWLWVKGTGINPGKARMVRVRTILKAILQQRESRK